jgi:hypothetical protein
LDLLSEIIEKNLEPHNFWGGQIPSFTSRKILFQYVEKQSPEVLKSGRLDKCLDALERARVHSSSEPRDLYALYVKNGMVERAKRFRERCKTTVNFDMEYYFKAVEKESGAAAGM